MILDSSVLLAILQEEPEWESLENAIKEADTILISSATMLETAIVIRARYGQEHVENMHDYLALIGAIEIPFSSEHRKHAEEAFAKYGKGQHHKAHLNFGDCISYGLAKSTGEPLLFVGSDFYHTDIDKVII